MAEAFRTSDDEIFNLDVISFNELLSGHLLEVSRAFDQFRAEINLVFGDNFSLLPYFIHPEDKGLDFFVRTIRSQLAAFAGIKIYDSGEDKAASLFFFVFPEFRKKGIATVLARKMVEVCHTKRIRAVGFLEHSYSVPAERIIEKIRQEIAATQQIEQQVNNPSRLIEKLIKLISWVLQLKHQLKSR